MSFWAPLISLGAAVTSCLTGRDSVPNGTLIPSLGSSYHGGFPGKGAGEAGLVQRCKCPKPLCPSVAQLTGNTHVFSSVIPEQSYFFPPLSPDGDQLSVTKGKMQRKSLSCSPDAREHNNNCKGV